MRPEPLEIRFWQRVDKTGDCWLWMGPRDKDGYGLVWAVIDGRRVQRAHRVSWALATGTLPTDEWVLHHCDNPPCVNPAHLFLGDAITNNHDMVAKGRQYFPKGDHHWSHRRPDRVKRGAKHYLAQHPERARRGDEHPLAKLTAAKVQEIRARAAAGETEQSLAVEYGVTYQHINAVVRRKFWRHV